ncbi:transcriptional repressor LexA [Clostridium thermarum]|uniref:transcriptional repressor LexA n=1 Tax=Clostridium thermarum TaxID=1716543 RepID=UPI0013D600A6|nr:transcriptional repressor LexA [Clostridium thermarum]
MKMDAAAKKIIFGKPFGLTMVKGMQGTGKSMTAAYRALYLKSSYCLYEDERVLVASGKKDNIHALKKFYSEAQEQYTYDYITLFSLGKEEPVHFFTVEDIVNKYFNLYKSESNLSLILVNKEEKLQIIRQCIEDLKAQYKRVKFIRECNEDFILEEINWIKSCDYRNIEDYMRADRVGRLSNNSNPARLIKNSLQREAIYKLMLLYNKKLKSRGLIDEVDKELLALEAIINRNDRYTHMVIDDAHELTRVQLNILMALNSKKAYSSMMLTVNHKIESHNGGWIIKGRKQKNLGFEGNIKNSYLKKAILNTEAPSNEEVKKLDRGNSRFMEKYLYVDIRHNKSFEFIRDTSNYEELILLQDDKDLVCSNEELTALPVYSNIAAGDPIAINPEVEDSFNLPYYWVKGMKDCFMLRVKGESMIGAGIEDGDLVVIRKQTMASNRDIVAVNIEGSATLKRLCIEKDDILLMPENEKYSPISIKNREAAVLGVVVGIIKNAA